MPGDLLGQFNATLYKDCIIFDRKLSAILEQRVPSPTIIFMPYRQRARREINGVTHEGGFDSFLVYPTSDEFLQHGSAQQKLQYLFKHSNGPFKHLASFVVPDNPKYKQKIGPRDVVRLDSCLMKYAGNFGQNLTVMGHHHYFQIADAAQVDRFLEMFPPTDEVFEEFSRITSRPHQTAQASQI